ncbi:P1 family peptidase [uncultured Microbacterium sp.]|uniref:DmpA family aminopeptidase n=1 Tax=uncultured Microbacterium sp. TaxID=191216 RepID=UPI0025F13F46|nr:P1 family peptidase [uncultured Microbacterium sp.]
MTTEPARPSLRHARVRARDLGVVFEGEPGPLDALTDVPGVEVGMTTLIEGDGPHAVRSGVTAILPRGRDGVGDACAAAVHSFNGNGELTGRSWIDESGSLGLPIALTNSHAVGSVHAGVDSWIARHAPSLSAQWLLPVVGETWDGYLNDINGAHVRPEHAIQAIDAATGGPVPEGNVGGGTGMNCYGFKGGTGTASRIVRHGADAYVVAALVQANFGARHELHLGGIPLGSESAAPNPMEESDWFARERAGATAPGGAGSAIVVIATNAPLLPGQCAALARRGALGLGRSGTAGSHFSGDIVLAFSTANPGALASVFPTDEEAGYDTLRFVPWGRMDPFLTAAVQAVDEAVWNALVAAEDMVGRAGHRSPALPHEEIRAVAARLAAR